MRNKRITKFMATVLAGVSAVSALAACAPEGCEHVYRWTVHREATCSEEGLQEGFCGICGDVLPDVAIPVDPDNHPYGAWEVTVPTQTSPGTAKKTCTSNAEHTLEVPLPALAEEDKYEVIAINRQPKPLEEGEMLYVFSNDVEDITFTVPIPAKGIVTVGDAVTVASERKNMVRSGTGTITELTYKDNAPTTHAVSYQFGDRYAHISGGLDKVEFYCSIDENGQFYGYQKDGSALSSLDESKTGYLDGFRYAMPGTGFSQDIFGAEELLSTLYLEASRNDNHDFTASIIEEKAGNRYTFSYGQKSGHDRIAKITVNFTLSKDYALQTLDVRSLIYSNNQTETTWEANEAGDRVLITDENGELPVNQYTEAIALEQITLADLTEEERENVPTNPYQKDAFLVSSFDVMWGTPVQDDTVISINADDLVSLDIKNIQPSTAVMSLPENAIQVYYVDPTGKENKVDFGTLNEKGILGYYSQSTGQLNVRSKISGDVIIRLKTKLVSKDIHFKVGYVAPTSLRPFVYTYNVNTPDKYIWVENDTATAYLGQSLLIKAEVPAEQAAYADPSYTATITAGTGATIEKTTVEGKDLYEFVATEKGTFTVTMQSAFPGSRVKCTLTITVNDPPPASERFNGSYEAELKINPNRGTKVTVSFVPDADPNTGSINVTTSKGRQEKLSYTYDPETRTFTTEHAGGTNEGYKVTMNDALQLVFVCPSAFDGEPPEQVVLRRPQAETP